MRACYTARALQKALKLQLTDRFSDGMRLCAVPTTKMAETDAPVAIPALGYTPNTPNARPAPLAALSCEGVNVGQCKCVVEEV